MYKHFCRCYHHFMNINEPSYRTDIAQVFEGLTDKRIFDEWNSANDQRAKELSSLIYLIGQQNHPRMKTLSYELEGYGFGTGSPDVKASHADEQLKLMELFLSTHYYS